ncbi:hypothetical protein HKX48_000228 [Thoreauomyces humboldtii]|nr:hypothetical protein HKX48_000228 [Thoreauomyces humboldtii]
MGWCSCFGSGKTKTTPLPPPAHDEVDDDRAQKAELVDKKKRVKQSSVATTSEMSTVSAIDKAPTPGPSQQDGQSSTLQGATPPAELFVSTPTTKYPMTVPPVRPPSGPRTTTNASLGPPTTSTAPNPGSGKVSRTPSAISTHSTASSSSDAGNGPPRPINAFGGEDGPAVGVRGLLNRAKIKKNTAASPTTVVLLDPRNDTHDADFFDEADGDASAATQEPTRIDNGRNRGSGGVRERRESDHMVANHPFQLADEGDSDDA